MDGKPPGTDRLGLFMGRAVTLMIGVTAIVAMICLCMLPLYFTIGWTSS